MADSGGRQTTATNNLLEEGGPLGSFPPSFLFHVTFHSLPAIPPGPRPHRPALGGGQLQPVRGGAAETPGLPPPPLSSIGAAALNPRGLGGLSGRSYHSQPSPPQPTSATVLFPSQSLSVRRFSVFPPCTTPTPNQRGLSSQRECGFQAGLACALWGRCDIPTRDPHLVLSSSTKMYIRSPFVYQLFHRTSINRQCPKQSAWEAQRVDSREP